MPYPGQIPMPNLTALSGNPLAALGSNPAGRPKQARPTPLTAANTPTGMPMPNITPEAVQLAQSKYLQSGQLPPALRPRAAGVLESRRHAAIQRGWQHHYSDPSLRRT